MQISNFVAASRFIYLIRYVVSFPYIHSQYISSKYTSVSNFSLFFRAGNKILQNTNVG